MGRGGIRETNQGSARRSSLTNHELSARRSASELGNAGVLPETSSAEDLETAVQDFVTDLMHLVEANGWDWSELEARAGRHFDVEMNLHARGEPHDDAAW